MSNLTIYCFFSFLETEKQIVPLESTAHSNSFLLNGHTLGFHPQTLKLDLCLSAQGLTLGVKWLKGLCHAIFSNSVKRKLNLKYIETTK